MLDTLTVADGATASSSATVSPDGLLYLPARLAWVQSNGDGETPTQTSENLFNAFDLNATPQITLPPPPNQRAHRSNGAVLLSWQAVADPGGQFSHYAIYRSSQPFTSLSGLTPIVTISNRLTVQFSDSSVTNGGAYYYFVATVSLAGSYARGGGRASARLSRSMKRICRSSALRARRGSRGMTPSTPIMR